MWFSGAGAAEGPDGAGADAGRRPTSAVLARGGVPAGSESAAFSPAELSAALDALDARNAPCTIMVEREGGGGLAARGGASAALAAAAARPAPHPPAAAAGLCARAATSGAGVSPVRPHSGWRLWLRTTRPLAPLDEVLVWPDAALRALAGVAPLTSINITGDARYVCERCGAQFAQPNPLKMHRYLQCAPPDPRAFLRRLLRALLALAPPASPPLAPPALEALCAAWGARAGGGRGGGHVCVYCGKAYSRRYGLKIHIRTHTGYRPLRCPHCARRFGDPSNLNKHVRLHYAHAHAATPAPAPAALRHRCARCGAVAARRRDLERHKRTRHPSVSPSPPTPAPG